MNELRPALRTAPGGRRVRDLIQQLDAIIWEADATTWQYTFFLPGGERGGGAESRGQGAGPGLALVRGLVELHGGRV